MADKKGLSSKQLFLLFIGLFVAIIISQLGSYALFNWLMPMPTNIEETPLVLPGLLSSFRSIFLAPIIEEWLFREKLLIFLNKKLSTVLSVILSSLLFSFIHLQAFFLPFFLGGMLYSIGRLISGKWWFSVLLHSSYNGFSLIILFMGVFLS